MTKMNTAGSYILFGGAYMLVVFILFFTLTAAVDSGNKGGVYYNCTWAEISPDMPPKVREECRKLSKQITT
jgi:hypothetical protein